MNRKKESKERRRQPASSSNQPWPSSSRLRRSASSASLRNGSGSQHAETKDTRSPLSPIAHPSSQQSNVSSRLHQADGSRSSMQTPHNVNTHRNMSTKAQPGPSTQFPRQQKGPSSDLPSPFLAIDSASSPVLSLRKGIQKEASRGNATQQSEKPMAMSYARLKDVSVPKATNVKEPRQSQTALAVPSSPSLTCPTCGISFPDRGSYKKHLAVLNHGHVCQTCGSKFAEKGNLNRHVKTVHQKDKPYICAQCGLGFSFRDGLRRHVDAVHWQIRPFRCANCEKSYKKKDHLRRHLVAFPGHKAAND